MLVDFGDAVREIKMTVIESVREWKLDQILLGEDLLDFSPEGFVHAVVVIGVEEATRFEILSESLHFFIGKANVPVSCHEDERIRKEVFARDFDKLILGVDVDVCILLDEVKKVDFLIWIVVPIPPAAVFETGDGEGASSRLLLGQRSINKEAKNETSAKQFRYVPHEFQCLFGVVSTKR